MKAWKRAKAVCRTIATGFVSAFDREDCLFLTAIACVGSGAWLFHPGAGLISAGLMLAFPFLARACSNRGPQE